ncbi:MAG: 4Fe-4S binding protein [Campylobacteraceae bacterium]|nr:4Fe-4S binding protein [Campylobacteraceae bacterium]
MMTRRDFFSSFALKRTGGKTSTRALLPYLCDVSMPQSVCPSCDAPCVSSCEENIIVLSGGIPSVDFKKGGCTFCAKCAQVCYRGVLNESMSAKIDVKIAIKTKECLSWNGTMCYTCKDACEAKAISFFGAFRPVIDERLCSGCGACISACEAISIKESV